MKKIRVRLDPAEVDALIAELQRLDRLIPQLINGVCLRLSNEAKASAENDLAVAAASYLKADGAGTADYTVDQPFAAVSSANGTRYTITAYGADLLFLEFGAGITYGGGHPLDGQLGYGPGTYPGQKHALTGNGWIIPGSNRLRSFGNPPSQAMYQAFLQMENKAITYLKEAFRNAGY